jgi:hypothetical protein
MPDLPLDVRDEVTGIRLVPAPVQILGGQAELDDEVTGEVLWFHLAAFFSPESKKRRLIAAHDDPGVRAADEAAAIGRVERPAHATLHPAILSAAGWRVLVT